MCSYRFPKLPVIQLQDFKTLKEIEGSCAINPSIALSSTVMKYKHFVAVLEYMFYLSILSFCT